MSMPIQRQSESFGIFDDGPRFARDTGNRDLPRGLAGLVNTTGPRIQAGLLNTRQAVNTEGMNPEDHAYGLQKGNPLFGEYGHDGYDYEGVSPSTFKRHMRDRDLDQEIADAKEEEDDYSGYNWGPEPSHIDEDYDSIPEEYLPSLGGERVPNAPWMMHGSRHPFDRAAARRLLSEYDDLPPLPDDFHIPDSPEGQPDRSPGWLYRQFVGPHKGVWDIPEHELDDRWNQVYDTLGFDPQTREQWESARNTGKDSDRWDGGMDGLFGGGVKDYLTRAPMSKEEYARHREDSKNRAQQLADGLWNAISPPEEEEGRKAVQHMDTINSLMANGWQPEHIKYDEDDEPYALYQHPSGWNIQDYGGVYKNIGHAATPDEAHDVINVSRYDRDSGESHNDLFGPQDAHNFIEEQLHGDPEETGGMFQYLMKNHPQIRRYKPRQAARQAKCDCWDGYERVPGTKPCAPGSCRKCDSHRKKESARLAERDGTRGWNPEDEDAYADELFRLQKERFGDHPDWDDDAALEDPYLWGSGDPGDRFEEEMSQWVPPSHRRHSALAAPPVPGAHGFQPAHRVGLPWRGKIIPGTVIGLDGPHVAVRWDDGQYSNEEPHNIQLL